MFPTEGGILQVATEDVGGGAARVAFDLFRAYREQGIASWLAVGRKRSEDPDVLPIHCRPAAEKRRARLRTHRSLSSLAHRAHLVQRSLARPQILLDSWRGVEDFEFPASRRLLALPPGAVSTLHCHNLHGGYFDLRVLPDISGRVPTILTLHDAWLLSGHCAHSFGCDRWLTGCGDCPDLTIYPAIRRDATASNWRRKQDIFASARLALVAPCRWLLDRAERSLLAPAIQEARVIPYGVDLGLFRPGSREVARRELGLPVEARVLLFAANGIRKSRWRDFETLRRALAGLNAGAKPLICLAIGDEPGVEYVNGKEMRILPFLRDPLELARFYRAADVYVHPALVDTFPNAVLEALACGLPIVATAVGGIPEQVMDGVTGLMVPARDHCALRSALERIISDDALRLRFSVNAAADARQRFNLARQVSDYLELYSVVSQRFATSLAKSAGD